MYAYPAGAGTAGVAAGTTTPAYAAGQYSAGGHHGTEAAAAAAAGGGSGSGSGSGVEMMVQTPYGMAPYSYMPFHGVPYASTQQGYQVRREDDFAVLGATRLLVLLLLCYS